MGRSFLGVREGTGEGKVRGRSFLGVENRTEKGKAWVRSFLGVREGTEEGKVWGGFFPAIRDGTGKGCRSLPEFQGQDRKRGGGGRSFLGAMDGIGKSTVPSEV
jgi:hypothetical protein